MMISLHNLILSQMSFTDMMPAIIAILVLFYVMFVIPERRKQKNRESDHKTRMENLKKNDRVETIGGLRGVVVNVKREENEVVIRVDEATNAKVRFNLASIARVEGDAKEEAEKNKSENNRTKAKT